MKVRLTPIAREDLAGILAYLRRHSPSGASHVGSAIRRTLVLLAAAPFMGRPGELPGSRVFPVRGYPYLIVYRVYETRGDIAIVSILHAACSSPYIDPS